MRKGFTLLTSLALLVILQLPAPTATAQSVDTVVARVNGEEITLGHMIIAYATLPDQYRQLPADVLYNGILDQLIQQSALSQTQDGDPPLHVRLSLENERRSLIAAEALEKVMAGVASEAEVQAAYDAQYGDGYGGEEYNASHILVKSEDEASAIKADLDAGADFAETAKSKSTGPSGPNGGALGWFGPGQRVPDFEAAVIAQKPGEISEPVQTQFGWHVIKLNETRQADAPALETVQDELATQLRREAVEEYIQGLTGAATIERPAIEGLQPEILQDLGLVRN